MSPRRIGSILVSGRGSNMRALIEAAMAPGYPVQFRLAASDRVDAEALRKAEELGISAGFVPSLGENPGNDAFERGLDDLLRSVETEIVCLAGFMRILSPWFVSRWGGRILNIHPSLLPRYPDLNTHERAIANGDRESGCSVHLVTRELDAGPLLGQERVPVLPGDTPETLAERVLAAEHRLYPAVVAQFAEAEIPIPLAAETAGFN